MLGRVLRLGLRQQGWRALVMGKIIDAFRARALQDAFRARAIRKMMICPICGEHTYLHQCDYRLPLFDVYAERFIRAHKKCMKYWIGRGKPYIWGREYAEGRDG